MARRSRGAARLSQEDIDRFTIELRFRALNNLLGHTGRFGISDLVLIDAVRSIDVHTKKPQLELTGKALSAARHITLYTLEGAETRSVKNVTSPFTVHDVGDVVAVEVADKARRPFLFAVVRNS